MLHGEGMDKMAEVNKEGYIHIDLFLVDVLYKGRMFGELQAKKTLEEGKRTVVQLFTGGKVGVSDECGGYAK